MRTMIGLMGAMPEEVGRVLADMDAITTEVVGRREYRTGNFLGQPVCLAFSRWGKVAAASTATTLIDRFGASELIFTGVAGAVDARLRIGDIVVATGLFQHDLDGSPLFQALEVPLLGQSVFPSDERLRARCVAASEAFAKEITKTLNPNTLSALGIENPTVYEGPIASGDQFISSRAELARIAALEPGALCVEMEGAAVAQVAYEHDIPFTVVRVISDSAEEDAAIDFTRFVAEVASHYAVGVLRQLLIRDPSRADG